METASNIIVTIDSTIATLSSTTVADMVDNYGNLALIGDELVCFETATFLGAGQYQLSGSWLRGIKGTIQSHVANERFVFLGPIGTVPTIPVPTSYIGDTIDYRVGSVGLTSAQPEVKSITFNANKLKPLSPVMLAGTRNGSNDLTITWVRRDRVYSEWVDNVDLQLSEVTLAFQVDILDSMDVVVRTIDAATATALYTAAQQTADGLTPGDPVKVRVYQLSQAVGRGAKLEGTI